MSLLKIENITKKFNSFYALSGVNFDIEKGEIHSLVGENGAGKSTLIKLISGIYKKTSGKFYWEGKEVDFINPVYSQDLGIGTVHQSFPLVEDLSVMENIVLGHTPTNKYGIVDWKEIEKTAIEIISNYNLNLNPRVLVRELSTAQRQLVSIVRILSMDAKLIILDEPTTTLSRKEQDKLFELIHVLKDKGVSILYISHELDDVIAISDSITVLRDGKTIETMKKDEISYKRMIRGMVGRELKSVEEVEREIGEDVVLEVKNLSSNEGIKNISFKLHKSEILGIGGLVGSGRTEILNAIYGYSKYDGEIYINGEKVEIKNIQDALKNNIGYLTEDRKKTGLLTDLSIKHNITINNLNKIVNNGILDLKLENEESDKYINKLNIKSRSRDQNVTDLSGGNQQKVIFAKWAMNNPSILFLDEPTVGVDIGAKEEIYEIIYDMTKQGISIILVSSDLPELLRLSDRILIMKNKELSGEIENREEFNQEKFMEIATKVEKTNSK
ncbi:sugar ABC transporter ATP-binding protein [Helcococcus sueciensis]|uniref:sugar ABC transporter ATP-binding protein n=1 Tax=Helcococcus sueciensis TaxID=241555 RepID=UPI0004099553|nr:sugar ABC transporter ATP-binding protein [Helcococcus sueciensis]